MGRKQRERKALSQEQNEQAQRAQRQGEGEDAAYEVQLSPALREQLATLDAKQLVADASRKRQHSAASAAAEADDEVPMSKAAKRKLAQIRERRDKAAKREEAQNTPPVYFRASHFSRPPRGAASLLERTAGVNWKKMRRVCVSAGEIYASLAASALPQGERAAALGPYITRRLLM